MIRSFGQYRLLHPIGEGGMAQVWAAERDSLAPRQSCAVKIMRPELVHDAGQRQMFEREASVLRAIGSHPNIASLLDAGEFEGRPYIATERVCGVTVAELSQRHDGPWPVEPAVAVAVAVLTALKHLHEYSTPEAPWGLLHRDVTPDNVMLSRDGEVKLIDFGIATPMGTQPSLADAIGKLGYVPREQIEGEADERADLYAVGAMLFELLDGRRFRWHCADEDALFQEIYRERVPTLNRDIPRPIRLALHGLLQPDVEQRTASAAEALELLEGWTDPRWSGSELEGLFLAVIGSDVPSPNTPPTDDLGDLAAAIDTLHGPSLPNASPPPRYPWHHGQEPTQVHAIDPYRLDVREDEVTSASPAWVPAARAATGDEPQTCEREPTRVIPHANPLDGARTRLRVAAAHKAAASGDIPTAVRAAEMAVTRPTPSRLAPWSAAESSVRPELGAPVRRQRSRTTESVDAAGRPIAPRSRESASMHQVASAIRSRSSSGDAVRGEIVADEAVGGPVWRLAPRVNQPGRR